MVWSCPSPAISERNCATYCLRSSSATLPNSVAASGRLLGGCGLAELEEPLGVLGVADQRHLRALEGGGGLRQLLDAPLLVVEHVVHRVRDLGHDDEVQRLGRLVDGLEVGGRSLL